MFNTKHFDIRKQREREREKRNALADNCLCTAFDEFRKAKPIRQNGEWSQCSSFHLNLALVHKVQYVFQQPMREG